MQKRAIKLGMLALMLSLLTGCEAIGDIFQAGMSVGIILVIVVVVIIIWIISKFRK
jgi:hypothetical protein